MNDLPLLFGGASDSRQLIVSVLSDKWPLNARQIHREISKGARTPITYQAVHKMLKQMAADGIVSQSTNGYSLSEDWVLNVLEFSKELHAKTSKKLPALIEIAENTTVSVEFNDFVVTPYYWMLKELHALLSRKPGKTKLIMHWAGAWPITNLAEKENEQMQFLSKKADIFILCNSDFPTDRYFKRFWKEYFNAKWKYCPTVAQKCYLLVLDDFIIQKYDSPQILRKYYEIYSKPNVDLPRIYKLMFKQKSKLKLVITRNRELAKRLREETLEYFK